MDVAVVVVAVGGCAAGTDDRPKLQDENTDAILSRTGGGDFGGELLPVFDSPPTPGRVCIVGGDGDEFTPPVPTMLSGLPVRGATVENRDARCEMNDPMLTPHVLSVAFVSDAACVAAVAAVAEVIDNGFKCRFGLGLRAGDVELVVFDKNEVGARKKDSCDDDLLRPSPALSKSECVISTGVLDEVLDPASFPTDVELADR